MTEVAEPLSGENARRFADALVLHEQGEFEQARALYLEILATQPEEPDTLHMLGVLIVQTGRFNEGIDTIGRAIALRPDFVEAHMNRGIALMQAQQLEPALEDFTTVARLAPAHFGARCNRALILVQIGRIADALAEYEALRTLAPDNAEVLINAAVALGSLRRWPEALLTYDQALRLQPQSPEVLHGRGIVLLGLNRPVDALESFDRALAVLPDEASLHARRGEALKVLFRYEEALEALTRSIALRDDVYETWVNRGAILRLLGRPAEALACQDRALAIRPNGVEALTARGSALLDLMRLEDAEASYDAAIKLDPNFVLARFSRSQSLLLRGEFADGWPEYETRKALRTGIRAYRLAQMWDGKTPLEGKTLFVSWEQGFGDTIQFYRYASLAADRGARVVVCVQDALAPLLEGVDPRVKVIGETASPPQFDLYAPLLSLPGAFATTFETIPPSRQVHPPAEKTGPWVSRLGPATKPRVGLVWAGRPEHQDDRSRSIPLALLSPLFAAGVELISLQKEIRASDQQVLARAPIRQFPLTDFADTAALISQLDLVISVDTSVAHLAAAMRKPTWILLGFSPDWRWFLDREESPWYPSARLFRQTASRDWCDVIDRVRDALKAKF